MNSSGKARYSAYRECWPFLRCKNTASYSPQRYKSIHKRRIKGRDLFIFTILHSLEAITAINRTIFTRFERNLSGYTAIRANHFMEFPGMGCITALLFPTFPAGFAATWFIGKTTAGVKLLFTGCENKLSAAIRTH